MKKRGSNRELINMLRNFRKDFFLKPNEEVFKSINDLDAKYDGNSLYDLNINGVLIDLGADNKSFPIISHAIKRLMSSHRKNPSDKLLFNIGNGFLCIADLQSGYKQEITSLMNNKAYRQARRYFIQVTSGTSVPPAATNSGNILEKYGRYYEAILLYDRAIKFNPNFGMALGNKALSLLYYYKVALKKNPDILFKVKDLLKSALAANNTIEIGGQSAIDVFQLNLDSLEDFLRNKENTNLSEYAEPSPYQVFCASKNSYLNFCFNCYKCKTGYRDNFFPPFIEKIKNISAGERLKYHSFSKKMYRSIKTLNQILEDYATSRSIYFNASTKEFADLDEDTEYLSALDYCINSVKFGYLKTTYLKLFNILDKIAHLAFYNYEIEQNDIYFSSLIGAPFKDFIINADNRGLLALHDLAWDFEANGIYNHLKIIRHYLTHEYLDIATEFFSDPKKPLGIIEGRNLTEPLLLDYIDELLQIVKAALLYFGQALKKDYDKVKEAGNTPLLPLAIPRQKDIYNGIE